MTAITISVGSRSDVRATSHRSRATADRSALAFIRWALALVLFVLGICGMSALAAGAGAGAIPPGGPEPGLGL